MENSIFESKEQYLTMRSNFKNWYNSEERKSRPLDCTDFALYAAIRGKDWRKCFTPATKDETIERIERYLTKTKLQYLYLTPYGETVTPAMIEALRENGLQTWGEDNGN